MVAETGPDPKSDRQLFDEAITEYLRLVRVGRPPDSESWIMKWRETIHPQLRTYIARQCGPSAGQIAAQNTLADLTDFTFDTNPEGKEAEYGRGNMGIVYKARQQSVDRPVAIKVMRPELRTDSRMVTRFFTEARLQGQLQEPAVPSVYALGDDPARGPFLVMQPVDGSTLKELLARRKSPTDEIDRFLKFFTDICEGVGSAHAGGVIHCDLKPSQIKVGANGRAYVTDWGLAAQRAISGPNSTDMVRSPGGTLAYMAPEQAGDGLVTPQSDVFALGSMLCEILTGHPAYRATGGDAADVKRELEAKARTADLMDADQRLTTCKVDAPVLVKLARRCMDKDCANRPTTGSAVATEVARYREEETKRRYTADEKAAGARKVARLWKILAVAVITLVVTLMLVAGGSAYYYYRQQMEASERRVKNESALQEWIERCERALRDDDPEAAKAGLEEIQRRLSEGATDDQHRRIARCEADLEMLLALDKIETLQFEVDENGRRYPNERLVQEYERLFSRYLLSDATAREKLATRVRDSLVSRRMLVHFDQWLRLGKSSDVLQVIQAADADKLRNEFRAAVQRDDRTRLAQFVSNREFSAQPVWFALAIGQMNSVSANVRREKLLEAHEHDRQDVLVLMALGGSYPINRRVGADDRIRWYSAAVVARPRNAIIKLNLGVALLDAGRFDEAISCYREVLGSIPQSASAYQNLGVALRRKGRIEEAISAYQMAKSIDPGSALPDLSLGLVALDAGNLDEAVRCLKASISLNPKIATSHSLLGQVKNKQRLAAQAIEHYRDALKIEPDHREALNNLGNALASNGDLPNAAKCYRKAILADPHYAEPHNGLGGILYRKPDLNGAIDCFKEAIRLNPEHAFAYNNLGDAYFDKGELDLAIASYVAAIRCDQNYSHPYNGLGIALHKKGKLKDAIDRCREAICLDSNNANAHNNLANALRDNGTVEEAISHYRTAIQIDSNFSAPYNGLGLALMVQGDPDGAIACFWDAICLDPNSATPHNSLGIMLLGQGHWDDAEVQFQEAIRLKPNYALPHIGLGKVRQKRGDLNGAIASFRSAIIIDPKSQQAMRLFEQALMLKGKPEAKPGVSPKRGNESSD